MVVKTLDKLAKRFKVGNHPTKLTPKITTTVLNHIAEGNYISTAVQAVGINNETFNHWLELADKGKEPYLTFSRLLKVAYEKAEIALIKRIGRAGEPEQYVIERRTLTRPNGIVDETIKYQAPCWTASAWILERTRNEKYGERSNVTMQFAKGMEFVKKVQKARETKAIKGEFRELPSPNEHSAHTNNEHSAQVEATTTEVMSTTGNPLADPAWGNKGVSMVEILKARSTKGANAKQAAQQPNQNFLRDRKNEGTDGLGVDGTKGSGEPTRS